MHHSTVPAGLNCRRYVNSFIRQQFRTSCQDLSASSDGSILPANAFTILTATGWVDTDSAWAASRRSSCCSIRLLTIPLTSKHPSVRVPVLSITTVPVRASFSRNTAPFTRIPLRLQRPMEAKKVSGIPITSAHGQLITRNVRAR